MAHTVADWWYQHVVGPMLLWLLLCIPLGVIGLVYKFVLGWTIPAPVPRFYVVSVLAAGGIVFGTMLFGWATGGDRWNLQPIDVLLALLSLVAIAVLAPVIYGWWSAWLA